MVAGMTFDHNIMASAFFVLMAFNGISAGLSLNTRIRIARAVLKECEGKDPNAIAPPSLSVDLFKMGRAHLAVGYHLQRAILCAVCGLTSLVAGYLGSIGGLVLWQ